jgi:hypothetical protein
MRNLVHIFALLLITVTIGLSQNTPPKPQKVEFFVKGGIGTSWIIMPKVFLIDQNDPTRTNNWQILPATNAFSGFIGLQSVIPMGKHWLFVPEIDYNYIAGEIRVDELKNNRSSQKLQTYSRIEVPLNFGILSSDNFWVSFGPIIFFTIADNKGFNDAVHELTPTTPLNSDNPIGLRFRLAVYASIGNNAYIDIKFESDLDRNFVFEDGIYNMKMSMQNITLGFGWRVTKRR